MTFGVLVLVVVAGITVVVARAIGSRGPGASDPPGEAAAVRRFFQYLLLFGLMVVVAIGVSGLIGRLLGGNEIVLRGGADLARSLTFTVVGLPVYAALAAWCRSRIRSDPMEARSLGWAFYVTLAALTALVVTMVAADGVLDWLLGTDPFDGGRVGQLLVWGAAWGAHWAVARRVPPRGDDQVHVLGGSLIGLLAAAGGLGSLLSAGLGTLHRSLGGAVMVSGGELIRGAVSMLVVGAPVWAWYWLRHGVRARRTALWHAYVLLVGVAGGLATAVVAASTVLYDILVWLFGDPSATTAIRHFDSLPGAVAATVVGTVAWWYHRTLLRPAAAGGGEPPSGRGEVDRVYEYLMAGVGLLAAAGGLTTVLVALVEAVTPGSALVTGAGPVNTLLAAVTLLVVGGPVWWVFWQRITRAEVANPAEEAHSPVRRIYLFALFGVGGLVAVIALLVAVFIAFEDVIEGNAGSETLRSMRFALGMLVTTGAVAAYHWVVYRSDRESAPPGPDGKRLSFVLLVGAPDADLGKALARATGAQVWQWRKATDDAVEAWSYEALVEALSDATAGEVMVIAGADGFEVTPIDRS